MCGIAPVHVMTAPTTRLPSFTRKSDGLGAFGRSGSTLGSGCCRASSLPPSNSEGAAPSLSAVVRPSAFVGPTGHAPAVARERLEAGAAAPSRGCARRARGLVAGAIRGFRAAGCDRALAAPPARGSRRGRKAARWLAASRGSQARLPFSHERFRRSCARWAASPALLRSHLRPASIAPRNVHRSCHTVELGPLTADDGRKSPERNRPIALKPVPQLARLWANYRKRSHAAMTRPCGGP